MSRSHRNSKHKMAISSQNPSDDEFYESSQTQKKKSRNLTESRKCELISSFCCYVIHSWNGIPLKRADLIKAVFGDDGRSFNIIYPEAKKELKKIMGLDLTEMRPNLFIVTNSIDTLPNDECLETYDPSKLALTHIILVIIHMSDGSLMEEKLYAGLAELQISPDADIVFGSVRKFINNELVKQGYLNAVTIDGEPPKTMYEWGVKAHKEISKKNIIEFVSEIYGCKPEAFSNYKKALKEENINSNTASDETLQNSQI
ncbi:unnamed protein product [Dimorphilus gyrociliatus]|uniref:MAGE domain-containing protein n=1 Tax=Dimorphilus gyrociliatus TaxID=2664684 RepID=A0A7I8W860_9ANNE|nr:unnamed protein product [Dimorphilus gyrociliatus]